MCVLWTREGGGEGGTALTTAGRTEGRVMRGRGRWRGGTRCDQGEVRTWTAVKVNRSKVPVGAFVTSLRRRRRRAGLQVDALVMTCGGDQIDRKFAAALMAHS